MFNVALEVLVSNYGYISTVHEVTVEDVKLLELALRNYFDRHFTLDSTGRLSEGFSDELKVFQLVIDLAWDDNFSFALGMKELDHPLHRFTLEPSAWRLVAFEIDGTPNTLAMDGERRLFLVEMRKNAQYASKFLLELCQ